tara:strand:- start:3407 stop:3721 length:315 start_codon:yes stop_codon:yes gene_type:complete
MSDGQYQRRSAVIQTNPCAEIHMQASMESIADMVQSSSKFKPGDKVVIKEILGDNNIVYTVLGANWSGQEIVYILDYNGIEMKSKAVESILEFAPINERRKLKL